MVQIESWIRKSAPEGTHIQTTESIAEHDTRTIADRSPDGVVRVDIILSQNIRKTVSEESSRFVHDL